MQNYPNTWKFYSKTGQAFEPVKIYDFSGHSFYFHIYYVLDGILINHKLFDAQNSSLLNRLLMFSYQKCISITKLSVHNFIYLNVRSTTSATK